MTEVRRCRAMVMTSSRVCCDPVRYGLAGGAGGDEALPELSDAGDVADELVAGGEPAPGSLPMPTPAGVHVKSTSPGSNGSWRESAETMAGTEKMRSRVRPFCICSPLIEQASSRSSRSPRSSGLTSHGPIGPNLGSDLARLNCGEGPTSWPSQSVCPPSGSTTSVTGPVRQETHLVKMTVGASGTWKPDSAAWSL